MFTFMFKVEEIILENMLWEYRYSLYKNNKTEKDISSEDTEILMNIYRRLNILKTYRWMMNNTINQLIIDNYITHEKI